MKLASTYWHGSPLKLDVLEPQQARGRNDFENMKAVYMTNNRLEAALYAIAKHLKNKATFGVRNNKLVILGDGDPAPGWAV